MENRFLTCCHDSLLIGTRSECDRLQCQGKHDPVFNVFYHKVNNQFFYCLNRNQLGQYWKCVVEDRDFLCSSRCDRCSICKEMSDVFSELQGSCFFIQKLLSLITMMKFLIDLFWGVYLLVHLIKETKNLELK